MSNGNYDDGRRDADIKALKEQMTKVWDRLEELQGWQNRAIGYVIAISSVLTLLVQYGVGKLLK